MRVVLAALAGFVLLGAACAAEAPSEPGTAGSVPGAPQAPTSVGADADLGGPVEEVVDGDTFSLLVDGELERVRLVGINAPERGECFAEQATAELSRLLAAGDVRLEVDESDRDQYGRLLRHVHAGGTYVNEALVAAGVARARAYAPDLAHQDELAAAEQAARADGAGLWAPDACGAPTDDAAAEVALVAAVADPPGPDDADPNAETVTVENQGAESVDLGGWVLKDTSASHRFTFPDGFVLEPAARVVVHTGCGPDTASDLHWCNQRSLVWNNDGDTAYLEDPAGNTVSVLDV